MTLCSRKGFFSLRSLKRGTSYREEPDNLRSTLKFCFESVKLFICYLFLLIYLKQTKSPLQLIIPIKLLEIGAREREKDVALHSDLISLFLLSVINLKTTRFHSPFISNGAVPSIIQFPTSYFDSKKFFLSKLSVPSVTFTLQVLSLSLYLVSTQFSYLYVSLSRY